MWLSAHKSLWVWNLKIQSVIKRKEKRNTKYYFRMFSGKDKLLDKFENVKFTDTRQGNLNDNYFFDLLH